MADWRSRNLERSRQIVIRSRARSAGAEGTHTVADVLRIYHEQGGRCFYCRTLLGTQYDVEHKDPLSRGGSNDAENICCSCHSCNARKSDRTAQEFLSARSA
jgi:5-methylcytosine-specific restriction endonuclease McrA